MLFYASTALSLFQQSADLVGRKVQMEADSDDTMMQTEHHTGTTTSSNHINSNSNSNSRAETEASAQQNHCGNQQNQYSNQQNQQQRYLRGTVVSCYTAADEEIIYSIEFEVFRDREQTHCVILNL